MSMMQPPMEPSAPIPAGRSSWPMVIGVIAIMFGSLGLMCYGCSGVSAILTPLLASSLPPEMQQGQMQGPLLTLSIVSNCTLLVLAVWQLIAGILLLRRRPSARVQFIAWAAVKIAASIATTAVSFGYVPEMVDYINQQMSQQPGGAPIQFTASMLEFFYLISLALMLIWPVFLLIWFARGRIRAEVATWGRPADQGWSPYQQTPWPPR